MTTARLVIFLLGSLLSLRGALANESVQLNIIVPGAQPCPTAAQAAQHAGDWVYAGNKLFFLENYTDGLLSNPAPIVGSQFWVEAAGKDPFVNALGNLTLAIDPQQWYVQNGGFPAQQNVGIYDFKTLLAMPFAAKTSQYAYHDWDVSNAPLYHSGDVLAYAPECVSTDGLPIFPYVSVKVMSDILPLPKIVDFPFTSMTSTGGGPPGYSLRNLLPAATGPTSQIRVKVFLNGANSAPNWTTITHLAVGVQASPGSPNTVSAPVELKSNLSSGIMLKQGMFVWSDWTPFPLSPGQVPIFIADQFTPASDGNIYWSRNCTTGLGAWVGASASYNQAVMPGSTTWQPTCSHAMIQVQVR